MKRKRVNICKVMLVIVLIISSVRLEAQNLPSDIPAFSVDLQVYFRQNSTLIEPAYQDNERHLSEFLQSIERATAGGTYRIDSITIRSAASPEGSYYHNCYLSRERGLALRRAIQARMPVADSCFKINAVGEDWTGFRLMVCRYEMPHRQEVLSIIDTFLVKAASADSAGIAILSEQSKADIRKIQRGEIYRWVLDNIFPYLRSAANSVECHLSAVALRQYEEMQSERPVESRRDTVFVVSPAPAGIDAASIAAILDTQVIKKAAAKATRKKRSHSSGYRFAIKTNMLSDLALCPNIEVEFPVGKHISLLATHTFPWYTFGNNRYAYEILNSTVECRYWFAKGKSKFTGLKGWFAGVYGGIGKGDVEWGGEGYQCRRFWNAGLSGGYSWPLGKRDNWRLEASLSLGCVPISYDHYVYKEVYDKLIYQDSGSKMWIGPTALKCSIVWMLPMNKKNRQK